jgi:hypothetical protein
MENNLFIKALQLKQQMKLLRAMKKEIIILRKFKPSERTKKQLNLPKVIIKELEKQNGLGE